MNQGKDLTAYQIQEAYVDTHEYQWLLAIALGYLPKERAAIKLEVVNRIPSTLPGAYG